MSPRNYTNELQNDSISSAQRDALLAQLVKCASMVRKHRTNSPSIYTGDCGISLMLYRLGKFLETKPELTKDLTPVQCYQEALQIIGTSLGRFNRSVTFLLGESGALALQAVLFSQWDTTECQEKAEYCMQALLSKSNYILALPKVDCELLYGRVGFLSCLYFVRRELNMPEFGSDVAVPIIKQVLKEGHEARAKSTTSGPPLLYHWHSSMYIGAGHGLAGIIHMLVLFKKELPRVDEELGWIAGQSLSLIVASTRYIVDEYLLPSGNVMSSQESASDRLVHWCHGAPGLAMVLLAMDIETFRSAAVELGEVVWERGLLKKGVGLCHGIAGNAMVFLKLSQKLNDPKWACRAQQFGLFALEHFEELKEIPDAPYSLFEGMAGFVWFLCELFDNRDAAFPGMG